MPLTPLSQCHNSSLPAPPRDEWLTQLVEELDESDSYEYLKHLTDVYRLHLFDAIMQYRAIFFDAPTTQVGGGWGHLVGANSRRHEGWWAPRRG